MSRFPESGSDFSDFLEASVAEEESDLPKDEFVSKMRKNFKIALSVAAFTSFAIGILLTFILRVTVGILFLVLGIAALLILPTILSYRCVVNKISLKEEFFVLFIKFKKEVLWESVKYRKITVGDNSSIKLYDSNGKKLISFDDTIVGFDRIVKMSKRSSITDYRK